MNRHITINEKITLDLNNRTIQCRGTMTDEEFYTALKDAYMKSDMSYEFPLEMIGEMLAIRSGWQFSDYTSRKCVKPEVREFMPQKPEPPTAPQTVLTYAPVVFEQGTSLEDIIRCVPDGVNLKSTRIRSDAMGNIMLEMPGQWKNQNIKTELVKHSKEMDQYEMSFHSYRQSVNTWNHNHPDSKIG
jgi:hypothetical protein